MRSKERRPLLETYRERRARRWLALHNSHIRATLEVMARRARL